MIDLMTSTSDVAVDLLERIPPIYLRRQLSPAELTEEALANEEGKLTSTGALMCDTGRFTGRSPRDRYIVRR